MEMIKANPGMPWEWRWVSINPNLTMEMIKANPDKPWVWSMVSRNEFAKHPEVRKRLVYREYCRNYELNVYTVLLTLTPLVIPDMQRVVLSYL